MDVKEKLLLSDAFIYTYIVIYIVYSLLHDGGIKDFIFYIARNNYSLEYSSLAPLYSFLFYYQINEDNGIILWNSPCADSQRGRLHIQCA